MPLVIAPEGDGQPLIGGASSTGTVTGSDVDWPTSSADTTGSVHVTITGAPAPGAEIIGTSSTTAVWMVPDPGYLGDLCLGLPEL